MAIDTKKLIKYIKKLVDTETKKAQLETKKYVEQAIRKALRNQNVNISESSTQAVIQKNVKPKKFTANPILNEMLNETAQEGKWKTIGADASMPPSAYMNGVVRDHSNNNMIDEEINDYNEDNESQMNVPSIDEAFQMKKNMLPDSTPIKKQTMQKNNGNIPKFLKSKLE